MVKIDDINDVLTSPVEVFVSFIINLYSIQQM